jgi:hypothetical protein
LKKRRWREGGFRHLTWLQDNPESLITSHFVVDEPATFLRTRGEPALALILKRLFFDVSVVELSEQARTIATLAPPDQ